MIRLTERGSDNEVYVAPHQVARLVPKKAALGKSTFTVLNTVEDDIGRYTEVNESPADICRLIAAWERRYTAAMIVENNELPIFVFMDGKFIRFVCCERTHEMNASRDIPETDVSAVHQ
jgi:hypothetical protein